MVVYINSSAKGMHLEVRCPERHDMLTVINAYYGYLEILQICQILH